MILNPLKWRAKERISRIYFIVLSFTCYIFNPFIYSFCNLMYDLRFFLKLYSLSRQLYDKLIAGFLKANFLMLISMNNLQKINKIRSWTFLVFFSFFTFLANIRITCKSWHANAMAEHLGIHFFLIEPNLCSSQQSIVSIDFQYLQTRWFRNNVHVKRHHVYVMYKFHFSKNK